MAMALTDSEPKALVETCRQTGSPCYFGKESVMKDFTKRLPLLDGSVREPALNALPRIKSIRLDDDAQDWDDIWDEVDTYESTTSHTEDVPSTYLKNDQSDKKVCQLGKGKILGSFMEYHQTSNRYFRSLVCSQLSNTLSAVTVNSG
jgi:hypothetical protein